MQRKRKVLFVDQDGDSLYPLKVQLEQDGFQTEQVGNEKDALMYLSKEVPDIIVLEIILPGLDGVETCYRIRKIPIFENTPIAFLTYRTEDYSQIAAFQAGADDFITKPINPRVFSIRLKALLKRGQPIPIKTKVEKSSLEIDEEKMIVIKNGKLTHWQNIEFEILRLLSSAPGKVFSRDEIYRKIWPNEDEINERRVDVYIRRIREKIGEEHILTIFGRGYKFMK